MNSNHILKNCFIIWQDGTGEKNGKRNLSFSQDDRPGLKKKSTGRNEEKAKALSSVQPGLFAKASPALLAAISSRPKLS